MIGDTALWRAFGARFGWNFVEADEASAEYIDPDGQYFSVSRYMRDCIECALEDALEEERQAGREEGRRDRRRTE